MIYLIKVLVNPVTKMISVLKKIIRFLNFLFKAKFKNWNHLNSIKYEKKLTAKIFKI